MSDVVESSRFEVSERVGETQAYYGDTFYKSDDFFLIGYLEEEVDRKYYLYELYNGNRLVNIKNLNSINDPQDMLMAIKLHQEGF